VAKDDDEILNFDDMDFSESEPFADDLAEPGGDEPAAADISDDAPETAEPAKAPSEPAAEQPIAGAGEADFDFDDDFEVGPVSIDTTDFDPDDLDAGIPSAAFLDDEQSAQPATQAPQAQSPTAESPASEQSGESETDDFDAEEFDDAESPIQNFSDDFADDAVGVAAEPFGEDADEEEDEEPSDDAEAEEEPVAEGAVDEEGAEDESLAPAAAPKQSRLKARIKELVAIGVAGGPYTGLLGVAAIAVLLAVFFLFAAWSRYGFTLGGP
jgi:hypothetical protein